MRCFRIAAALVLFSFLQNAGAITVDELQKKMVESEARTQSVRFGYVQTMRSDASSEVRESSGLFHFKQPRKVRIDQSSPEEQTIVSSGKAVYAYTPRFKQALKKPWDRWFSDNAFFPGMMNVSGQFQALCTEFAWSVPGDEAQGGGNTILAVLKGLKQRDGQVLKIWVDAADFVPMRTEWTAGGLSVSTELRDFVKNPEIKDEFFKFIKPQGVDVIEVP